MSRIGPFSEEAIRHHPDGRSIEGRLLRSTRRSLLEQLGGADKLTQGQHVLVERVVMLQLRLSLLDQKMFKNSLTEYDEKAYLAWNNSLIRALRELGLSQSPAQPVDPMARLHNHLADGGQAA